MKSKIVSEPTGDQMTLFSPVGSLNYVSRTASQENDSEKKMTDTSGQKCLDAFGRLSRAGSWARTFSELLIGTGDWYSMRCRLTWKLKGTKYKRMYFQLAPSTPRTGGIGFGLLLTPTTMEEVKDVDKFKARMEKYPNGTTIPNLATQVVGLLPTPQAIDGNGEGRDLRLKKDCNRDPEQPGSWRGDLKDFAVKGMLPTPNSRDEKGSTSLPGQYDLNRELGITGRQLNPQFVAEMMGFPPDWTALPFLNGETNPLKHTETP